MEMKVMANKCDEVAALLKQFVHPQRLLIRCDLSDSEKLVKECKDEGQLG